MLYLVLMTTKTKVEAQVVWQFTGTVGETTCSIRRMQEPPKNIGRGKTHTRSWSEMRYNDERWTKTDHNDTAHSETAQATANRYAASREKARSEGAAKHAARQAAFARMGLSHHEGPFELEPDYGEGPNNVLIEAMHSLTEEQTVKLVAAVKGALPELFK